jgi:hypothetical protein
MIQSAAKPSANRLSLILTCSFLVVTSGCFRPPVSSPNATPNGNATTNSATPKRAITTKQVTTNDDGEIENVANEERRQKDAVWNEGLKATWKHIRQSEFDQAGSALAKLKAMELELTSGQLAEFSAAESELDKRQGITVEQRLNTTLKRVVADIDRGKLEAASDSLDEVLAAATSANQIAEAGRLKAIVNEQLAVLKRTSSAVEALASDDRDEVLKAQNQLFEDAENAVALLNITSKSENPVLVRNSLEALGKLQRPTAVLPIMLAVLTRPAQQLSWNDAIEQIEILESDGAGEALLTLALSSQDPAQREAALRCLTKVPDPPANTFVVMLPLLQENGPNLAAELAAARHGVEIHQQHDLLSRRGLNLEIDSAALRQIGELRDRLKQIIAGTDRPAAIEAMRLGIATRQLPAKTLSGISVLAFSGEETNGRAAYVLDGIWNTVNPAQMWRHKINEPGSIVLDLGAERAVTGVRIWNFNETNGTHRGWKDVIVYVGNSPTELVTPAATGQVPQASGVANMPDYSTTIPVTFARGRYLRLEASSAWRKDSHMGLTEITVLGY